jgi:predicted ATPase
MRAAIAEHDALVRETVAENDGALVKLTGDGAMAAFDRAGDALAAAVELQRALVTSRWPVPIAARMGLHTGDAAPGDGDYHGPAVNRAARVAGAGHGGQVLLSDATAALVGEGATVDLGVHHLKGLSPMRLHQVLADGLPAAFPPLTVERDDAGAMPRPATSFVGREAEMTALMELLGTHRLVTLTGAGGSGKTRLAVELAGQLDDRVAFTDLAPVASDDDVAMAVAAALGLSGRVVDDLSERVCDYLSAHSVVCILDNCEHVLDAVADLASVLLSRGDRSRLVVTSREPVGIPGEQIFAVAPLATDTAAVELFVARAREARPTFTLDDDNRGEIEEICRRLDGIPLAIELAAARTAHLSTGQLVARLDDRFRVLTGGRRRVARHQTLAATLDWSYELLDPDERAMLRHLAVFPASFSLDAAEALAGVDEPLDTLGSLVAKSLVQLVPQPEGSLRYRLLETVRIYGSDRLAEAGESEALHRAHRDHVVEWLEAQPLEQRWFGDRDIFAEERSSIRAALQWSMDRDEPVPLAQLASGVDWTRSADWHDGRRWTQSVIERLDEVPADLHARLLLARLMHNVVGGEAGALGFSERAMEAAERGGDVGMRAVACAHSGLHRTSSLGGSDDATIAIETPSLVEEGVRCSLDASTPWQLYCRLIAALAYTGLGSLTGVMDERAEPHLRAGLDLAQGLEGYDGLQAALREYLGLCRLVAGDASGALEVVEPAADQPVFPFLGVSDKAVLALSLAALGRQDEAWDCVRAGCDLLVAVDTAGGPGIACLAEAGLAVIAEDWEAASRLLGSGGASARRSPMLAFLYFRHRELVRANLSPDRYRALRDEGRALGPTVY